MMIPVIENTLSLIAGYIAFVISKLLPCLLEVRIIVDLIIIFVEVSDPMP